MSKQKYVLIFVPSNDAIETRQFPTYDAACAEMLAQVEERYLSDGGDPAVWETAKLGDVFEEERLGFWVDDPELANAFYNADGARFRWLIEEVTFA